jgi:outer membrane protein TolC
MDFERCDVKFIVSLIYSFMIISNVSASNVSNNVTLSQISLLQKVCENNFEIKYQKYDLTIVSEQVKKELAIFEPNFSVSYNYKDSITPNTAEQFFDRMYMEKFKERVKQYQLGVKGLLPVGTVYSFDYTIDDISVGLEFLLPLKGGNDSTSELRMAKIREKQAQIAVESIKLDLKNM